MEIAAWLVILMRIWKLSRIKHAPSEKGNVEDLKQKLEELLTRPDIVEKYRKESADYICGRFNWDDVVDRTICLYMQKGKRKVRQV